MSKSLGEECMVRVVALQAGKAHSQEGNPGPEANLGVLMQQARGAAASKPDLIAFPEYAISGWPYPPEEAINGLAEAVPGSGIWYGRYVELAKELATPLLCWLLEIEDGHLYNCACLLDREGQYVGKYRKVQANLGEQARWGWSQGGSFQPIELDGVRYGISICSDMWFPETVRCEELLGADVIVHISIADDMGHIVPTRAFDSGLPIVMSIFQGGSYAVDDQGALLAKLDPEQPGWIAFDLKPFQVRRETNWGGRFVPKLSRRNARNVAAYQVLVDPATRPAWTDIFSTEGGMPRTRQELLARFHGHYDANDPYLYHAPLVSFDAPWTSPYRVDSERPFSLVNQEGEHLYVVNKTAWAYFGCHDPAGFLQRARRQGANVIRVALEGSPYYPVLGIDMWPWGGSRIEPDWATMNDAYWDQVEERVSMAGEAGLGLDVAMYFTLHPAAEDIAQHRRYWEEALRRLGRYANVLTWEIANEYTANESFQDAAGAFFHARDPYHRPVCSSAGTTDDALWPDKPWMDLAINHTCTGSTERHHLRWWYEAVARNTRAHGKPAFCNESGREKRHQNDDGVHRRKQGWLRCACGGFWTWHTWDGCEGIDDPNYRAPGEEFLLPMASFFSQLPHWLLAPNHTAFVVRDPSLICATLASADRTVCVAYICTPDTGVVYAGAEARVRLPDGDYLLTFLRPSDLQELGSQPLSTPGLRQEVALDLPAFTDDLVIKVERVQARPQTLIPGTR